METYKFIQSLFLLFLLFNFSILGDVQIIEEGSKYEIDQYLNFFQISKDIMEFNTNSGELNRLSLAFDNYFISCWVSKGSFKKEYTDPKTNTKYDSLIPNITITFSKKVLINRMIYKALTSSTCENGLGYPKVLGIYYKNRDSDGNLSLNDEDFILVENIISQPTGNKVLFTFNENILCDQIKIEYKDINLCQHNYGEGLVSAAEILLLAPESENINENIINAFDKSDYRELTLLKEYKNEQTIKSLEKELKNYVFSEKIKHYVERIIGISNGSIVYDPRREFTTNQKEINKIYQRGDINRYSTQILKMWQGGTNRQLTGIYAKSNETITIYLSKEYDTNLPCIRFTQYIGLSRDWLGNLYCPYREKETFKVTDFKTEEYVIPSIPGGPIYFTNPYTSDEQSENIKIYIDGGSLYPIFRIDDDESNYMKLLEEYVELVNKDNLTYPDITEFYGNRVMMTVRATHAYKIYKNENKSPLKNLQDWDIYMKKLFIYDGLQFEKNQPYYDEKNNYICIHFRYSQPYALAYAGKEHIGIFYDDWIEKAISINEKEIDWGFPHEIGHMMDINERTISETSNNMISKYSETFIQGDGSWGPDRQDSKIKYLVPDDIENKLRGCKSDDENQCYGFFKNVELNYLIWWDLESIFHGYWGKLDNMYRYNNSLGSGLTREEKFVYFTNIILGMDLGYYFTRWGLYLNNYQKVFNEETVSARYQELMYNAINDGLIDINIPQKKYWYIDYKQYNYMNDIGLGCYEDQEEYNIKIKDVDKLGNSIRLITIENVKCPGHLGFEIYESDKLIGFTYSDNYSDETVYGEDYVPKYKVIAYDRLLFSSKHSPYMSSENDEFLFGVSNF